MTLVVMVALAGWTSVAEATVSITAWGVDANLGAGWRSSSVAKNPLYDQNGDGAYGSDGYYVAGKGTILSSLPSYIASVTKPADGGGVSFL